MTAKEVITENSRSESVLDLLVRIPSKGVFYDIGSGEGHVCALAYGLGFNPCIGIEMDLDLIKQARRSYPWCDFKHADAEDWRPQYKASAVFMFNPFDEKVVKAVEKTLRGYTEYVAYLNSVYVGVFLDSGHWEPIYYGDKRHLLRAR